jgi:hypothetical protein
LAVRGNGTIPLAGTPASYPPQRVRGQSFGIRK